MPAAPIVALDTETTGRHLGRRAWEVGMIRRDPDGRQGELRLFVDVDVSDAEEGALDIGRYWQRHPNGRAAMGLDRLLDVDELYSPAVVAGLVWQWTRGAVVIGCTVNFDTETLAPLLLGHGLEPEWDYHILDVTTYAAGYLRGRAQSLPATAAKVVDPGPPPYKSHTIAERLGIAQPAQELHTALGDARRALRMFDRVNAVTAN